MGLDLCAWSAPSSHVFLRAKKKDKPVHSTNKGRESHYTQDTDEINKTQKEGFRRERGKRMYRVIRERKEWGGFELMVANVVKKKKPLQPMSSDPVARGPSVL